MSSVVYFFLVSLKTRRVFFGSFIIIVFIETVMRKILFSIRNFPIGSQHHNVRYV